MKWNGAFQPHFAHILSKCDLSGLTQRKPNRTQWTCIQHTCIFKMSFFLAASHISVTVMSTRRRLYPFITRRKYVVSWEVYGLSVGQKSSVFYGIRRFSILFTKTSHRTLSWVSRIVPSFWHFISLRFILILSSLTCICFPSGLFPSGVPIKISCSFLISPYMLHVLPIPYWLICSP